MIKVTVPATSANLGSGLDCFGVALTLYNHVYMEACEGVFACSASGAAVPQGLDNLIVSCAKKVYDICGFPFHGLSVIEEPNIPQARGLGSSSACIVAGILGANHLLGGILSTADMINLAAKEEGHPDNSTPAILGGFVTALMENDKVLYVRAPVTNAIKFAVFVPDFELKTKESRKRFPDTVLFSEAVMSVSRAALLASSLAVGKTENVEAALRDSLHQPYRIGLIENGQDIIEGALSLGALGAYISGAGSSIMAILHSEDKSFLSRAQKFCRERYPKWQVQILYFDAHGASVKEEHRWD